MVLSEGRMKVECLLIVFLVTVTIFRTTIQNKRQKIRRLSSKSSRNSESPGSLIVPIDRRLHLPYWGETKWCPNSECHNSNVCQPCRRRWLIILATGRSASTTLLYMLNSLPGVRLSGENNDELKVMKRAIDNVRRNKDFVRGTNQKSSWGHREIPEGAYGCVVQTMMETINPPGKHGDDDSEAILGFKTIRFFNNVNVNNMEDLAQYLKESFPCARFVLNIRSNTKEQAKSMKAAFPNSNVRIEDLDRINELVVSFAKLLGDSAYLLDSTEWLENIEALNSMVSWLGFTKSCAFSELEELNTSIYSHGRVRSDIDLDCHLIA